MKFKLKTHLVPPVEKGLLARLHTEDSWILDTTTENIERFNVMLDGLPRNYKWESLTAEAFQQMAGSLRDKVPGVKASTEIYRLYWIDMLGQIEAFSIMSAWRLAEITRSAIWAIRRDDVLCGAVMARAALETAAAYAWLQTEIRPTLEAIGGSDTPTFAKFHENDVVKDLEEKLLKVVYASKAKGSEDFYTPTNIVTIIEKIARKIPDQEIAGHIYSSLCEFTHPNWAGRSIYIVSVEPGRIAGHEKRTISNSHGAATENILRDSITAVSWATGTFSRSCAPLQTAVGKMKGHLDRASNSAM